MREIELILKPLTATADNRFVVPYNKNTLLLYKFDIPDSESFRLSIQN